MKQTFWNPKLAEHEIMGNAMKTLTKVGDMMADEVRKVTPVGTVSRPMYETGKYAEEYWTARDAGALKRSVRTVPQDKDDNRNVWIMCGNRKVYYGKIVEFYKPFFRKAINRSKSKAKAIFAGGGV